MIVVHPLVLVPESNFSYCRDTMEETATNGGVGGKEDASSSRRNRGICPICRAQVKHPSVLSFMRQCHEASIASALRQGDDPLSTSQSSGTEKTVYTSRKYVDAFLASPEYEKLLQIEYHGVNNMRRIRKELTETYAALQMLKRRYSNSNGDDDDKVDLNTAFVIDLCSGKSLTTLLCGLAYPQGRFLAVDKLPAERVAHHIEYWSCDILIDKFEDDLFAEIQREVVTAADGQPGRTSVILVGMHLCGSLSERAIALFAKNTDIEALLLCPCCLPRNPKGAVAQMRKELRQQEFRSQADMYHGWVDYLHEQCETIENVTIQRHMDLDMHSNRNCLLWVTRNKD